MNHKTYQRDVCGGLSKDSHVDVKGARVKVRIKAILVEPSWRGIDVLQVDLQCKHRRLVKATKKGRQIVERQGQARIPQRCNEHKAEHLIL